MTKELHIDYLTFSEEERVVAFAPQLQICFDAPTEDESLKSLRLGAKALFDFWKGENKLANQIESLRLNGTTTPEERETMERNIKIPYFVLRQSPKEGVLDINVEV